MAMKIIILALIAISTSGYALERSVPLPYDYSRSITNNVYVPRCTAGQYVSVSGTVFVCKSFPVCGTNQVLSSDGTNMVCKDMAMAQGTFCGLFSTYAPCPITGPGQYSVMDTAGSRVVSTCQGMGIVGKKFKCPTGYSLRVIQQSTSSCGGHTTLSSCLKD